MSGAAATIALVQSQSREFNQFQKNVATALRPVTSNTMFFGNLLQMVALASGANSINHKLNRPLTGWFITRIRASATLYDTQDTNTTPSITLDLIASAAVIVDLWVF